MKIVPTVNWGGYIDIREIDFKKRNITRDEQGHFIMLKDQDIRNIQYL